MTDQELAQRILKLRDDVTKAQRLRAEAEATMNLVSQRLAETEAALKDLGVDPAAADEALQTLKGQLEQAVLDLEARVQQEITVCQKVTQEAKTALAG